VAGLDEAKFLELYRRGTGTFAPRALRRAGVRLAPGGRLGAYRIVEYVGKGGMAEVYKGYHEGLDRTVAIKILPDFFVDDRSSRDRFHQEARSIARLNHPNILRIFDFGEDDGVPYLVLEFIEGDTLADRLGKPMPLESVVKLLTPIASALDHAHSEGLLHRDVKPSNILMRTDGTPMLADFGLARMADSARKLTATGLVMGTPEYMSPEQISEENVGPASDVYALTVVAHEMLTGRVPFEAKTAAAVLVSHLNKPMPPTPELTGEASAHLEAVLKRGLAKVPEQRYPNASELIAALRPAAWPDRSTIAAPSRTTTSSKLPVVLVVDDSEANRELIEACLAGVECLIQMAETGAKALAIIQAKPPDLVLLDVQMPEMDGYEVCRRIKASPEGKLLPVVMITGLGSVDDRVLALESGADDFMSKPVERTELLARVQSALRLKAVYKTLDNAQQVIVALAAAVEAKEKYTQMHAQRVADMAHLVGARVGLSTSELDILYRGALIHDVGKIGVPEAILLKPGRLTEDEQRQMQEHPVIGERIVRPLNSGAELLSIIRNHHERFDGLGYPDGLSGASIPRGARIVAVCDAYDALINDRPYRSKLTSDEALRTLFAGAGTQWDPDVVNALSVEFLAPIAPRTS
jgi:putative two-component system response regulator